MSYGMFSGQNEGFSMWATEAGHRGRYSLLWTYNMSDPHLWTPQFVWPLSHSLANPRAKINRPSGSVPTLFIPWSESLAVPFSLTTPAPGNQGFHLAHSIIHIPHGFPHFMNIPRSLSTFIGSWQTFGRVRGGDDNLQDTVELVQTRNVPINAPTVVPPILIVESGDYAYAHKNSRRWHGRFSLPSTTRVHILGNPELSAQQQGQLLGVYFTFRTWNYEVLVPGTYLCVLGNVWPTYYQHPWDLSTYANSVATTVNQFGEPLLRFPPGWSLIPPGSRSPINFPWTPPVFPETEPEAGRFPYRRPRQPMVIFDLNLTSADDARLVGTH